MATRPLTPFQVFLMVLTIVFWGSSFVVVKAAIGNGLTAIALATFRFLIASIIISIILLTRRAANPNYSLSIEKKDLLTLLILALTGVTFFYIAQYTGIALAGASIASILVCLLSPILITLFSLRIFKGKLTKRQVFGLVIAVFGTFSVISADLFGVQQNQQFLFGTLILLSTPVMWAVYSLLGEKMMNKYDPFLVVAYVTIIGGVCLVPFSIAEGSLLQVLTIGANAWIAILYLAVTCSILSYWIWFYVLKKAGSTVSSFLFAEPLVTAVFAVAFIGEKLTAFVVSGAFLIFIAVYFVNSK